MRLILAAALTSLIIGAATLFSGCSTQPQLSDYLQTRGAVPNTVPTQLTDWGIFRFGEDTIIEWGGHSIAASVLATGGEITLATLSTAALAMSGQSGLNPNFAKGAVAGGNWLLQMLGIIKPAERNDYRLRGEMDITVCRGDFFKGLAAKKIGTISTSRFTPQGAIYLDCIGGARMLVSKGINGLRPSAEDFERLKPVPVNQQVDPGPEVVTPKASVP